MRWWWWMWDYIKIYIIQCFFSSGLWFLNQMRKALIALWMWIKSEYNSMVMIILWNIDEILIWVLYDIFQQYKEILFFEMKFSFFFFYFLDVFQFKDEWRFESISIRMVDLIYFLVEHNFTIFMRFWKQLN